MKPVSNWGKKSEVVGGKLLATVVLLREWKQVSKLHGFVLLVLYLHAELNLLMFVTIKELCKYSGLLVVACRQKFCPGHAVYMFIYLFIYLMFMYTDV